MVLPIANEYPTIEAEYKKVITADYANSTDKNKALASVYFKWQDLLDTVLNLKLDITIDAGMLKALRDRAVTRTPYSLA